MAEGAASQKPRLKMEFDSDPMLLCGVREMVASISRRCGLAEMQSSQVALAVDEALCNVFRHGYDRRADRPIWLSLWTLESGDGPCGVRIVIEDEARQVDPSAIKSRDLEDIRPGGLGVHIIREVMDEATYEKRDGAGMRLTLVKRAAARACGDGKDVKCEP